ncbi:MAG: hypothetical protein OXH14_01420 [Alphaproteobacteria bacterium]|nr:hypothetical protein [Alphaproteobacteria bacterium]MCY3753358.1 hypothetical protein [Alphaproteobacteria bacterium]
MSGSETGCRFRLSGAPLTRGEAARRALRVCGPESGRLRFRVPGFPAQLHQVKGEFRAQLACIDMPGGAPARLHRIAETAGWHCCSFETFPAEAGGAAEIAVGVLDPAARQLAGIAQLAQRSLILATIRHMPAGRYLREEFHQVAFPAPRGAEDILTMAR